MPPIGSSNSHFTCRAPRFGGKLGVVTAGEISVAFDVLHGQGEPPLFYRYCCPQQTIRGRVLLVHGVSEHGGRYEHVMRALAERGIASVIGDHRGHGRNATLLGYSPDLQILADDVHRFRRRLRALTGAGPLSLWGHSMGGLVSLLHLAEAQEHYDSAVLASAAATIPDHIPDWLIRAAPQLARRVPKLGVLRHSHPEWLTRDEKVLAATATDPLVYRGRMRAATGAAILKAMRRVGSLLQAIRLPVLITHGDDDHIVPVRAAYELEKSIGSRDKTLRIFDGWRHELHNEIDRASYIRDVINWIESRWPKLRFEAPVASSESKRVAVS